MARRQDKARSTSNYKIPTLPAITFSTTSLISMIIKYMIRPPDKYNNCNDQEICKLVEQGFDDICE